MKFNFFVIPLVIAVVAILGSRYIHGARNVKWFDKLKKPFWMPGSELASSAWTMAYLLAGAAILWFWNIPVFGAWHYAAAIALLAHAALSVAWHRLFYERHDLAASYRTVTAAVAFLLVGMGIIAPISHIAAMVLAPYALWMGGVAYGNRRIMELNRSK